MTWCIPKGSQQITSGHSPTQRSDDIVGKKKKKKIQTFVCKQNKQKKKKSFTIKKPSIINLNSPLYQIGQH